MRLSLSGFLFEDDYRTQSLSFADFAALARRAGYSGVELRGTQVSLETSVDVVARYRAILDDHGLCVTCMTPRGLPMEFEERDEMFLRYLDLAERMNCQLLKVSGESGWLRKAACKAAARGIVLATNVHVNSPAETVAGAKTLLEAVDHSNFGLLYDPMHLAIAGEDYLGAIETLYPHIRGVLVQCVRPALDGEEPVIAHRSKGYVKTLIDDEPVQDWPAVSGRLKRLGYDGWITVIENAWPQEQREEVAIKTADYLRELWEGEVLSEDLFANT